MSHLAVDVVRNALAVGIVKASERLRLPGEAVAFREPDPEEAANLRLGAGFLQRIGIGAELQSSRFLEPSSLAPAVAGILGERSIRHMEISWPDFSDRVRADVNSLHQVIGALIDGTPLLQARAPFFDMLEQVEDPRPLHRQEIVLEGSAVSVFFREWFQRQAVDPEIRSLQPDLHPLTRVRTSEPGSVRLSFWGPKSVRIADLPFVPTQPAEEEFGGFLIPPPGDYRSLPEYPQERFGNLYGPYDRDPALLPSQLSRIVVRRDLVNGREYVFAVETDDPYSARMTARKWLAAYRLRDRSSPHLVRPRAVFQTRTGRPVVAFDYLPGVSLGFLMDHGGSLPLHRAVDLSLDLLSALDEVHGSGLLHRDLKPDNVRLSPDRGGVLLDFGIAEALDPTTGRLPPDKIRTADKNIEGTKGYMAPEACCDALPGYQPPGPSYDRYGVGLLLYGMVTGEDPFPALISADILDPRSVPEHAPLLRDKIPDEYARNPRGVEALETIVIRATRHHETDRYPDSASFREALLAWRREFSPSPQ